MTTASSCRKTHHATGCMEVPGIHESDHWYHYSDGIMRNGLTVATYALTDADIGDGGFACIPGSHKTNFLRNLPDDVAWFDREADYVYQPPIEAGDVIDIHGSAHPRYCCLASGARASCAALQVQSTSFTMGTRRVRTVGLPNGDTTTAKAHGAAIRTRAPRQW